MIFPISSFRILHSDPFMTKTLIVAEKPSVAADIAKALGGFRRSGDHLESDEILITSAMGHLVELVAPESQASGHGLANLPVIPAPFQLSPISERRAQYQSVAKLMNRSDVSKVVNACDAGREGELIFRLIYELAGCKKAMWRMWMQSMTTESIRQAYRSMLPGSEKQALGDAARSRAEADWLVGINASRALSRLQELQLGPNDRITPFSAGRVQTPTLAILVHLERAIRDFQPRDFWELIGTFGTSQGSYKARWVPSSSPEPAASEPDSLEDADGADATSRFFDKTKAQALMARCAGAPVSKALDIKKRSSVPPPLLFDLTELQREANRRFKYSAKKTLDIAQSLYERHKVLSYPRTDSNHLPEDYLDNARSTVQILAKSPWSSHASRVLEGGWIRPNKRVFDNNKISDHFAIVPLGNAEGLNTDEAAIYEMVVRRFLAAFHPAAEYDGTTRITEVAGETFKCSGRVLVTKGWLEVYGRAEEKADAQVLCALDAIPLPSNQKMELKTGKTKPPSRLTEAGLLTAMETAGKKVEDEAQRKAMADKGLGTPATRAAIIEGLLQRPYVSREGKEQYLVPNDRGHALIEFLENSGIDFLTKPALTGEWEARLHQVQTKALRRSEFMADIVAMTRSMIDVFKEKAAKIRQDQPSITAPCPKCKGSMQIDGKQVVCSGCKFAVWRTVAGRAFSIAELDQLLTHGALPTLSGFVGTKTKKPFSAAVKFGAEDKLEFVFEPAPPPTASAHTCPNCSKPLQLHAGTYASYRCEKCKFRLWRQVCQREFSDAEVSELLRAGVLGPKHGFVSRQGRKFGASLRLDRKTGNVSFEMENA